MHTDFISLHKFTAPYTTHQVLLVKGNEHSTEWPQQNKMAAYDLTNTHLLP